MELNIKKEQIENHNLTDREYEEIKDILKREPNLLELGLYGVLWSEHCSYKSSKSLLKDLPSKGHRILQGPGENAGIIYIGDGHAIVMKVESHNHPSAIEPYQGAATGVGGIIRDIIAMGARPIALLNSLRFGNLESNKNKHLLNKVVEGISGYGNCIGIPTVGGEIYYSECYNENPLVNVMCVGLVKQDNIVKSKAEGVGNLVIYAGAPTGCDGIKGASFASKELHEKSEEDLPSVQVGDPFTGKLLLEACMEISTKDYLVCMQDMGAAGLTSSSSEMAAKGGLGIVLDLDLVPKRAKDITPYQIMLSESQERMLLVVKSGYEDNAIDIFKRWGLNACTIGYLKDDGMLTLKSGGKIVGQVPAKSLTEAPKKELRGKKPHYLEKVQAMPSKVSINEAKEAKEDYNKSLKKVINSPTISSKEEVYRQYDYMVGTNTVLAPGKSDASLMRIKGLKQAIALTLDGNSRYCYIDPYEGGKRAVCEAARNLACVGAYPIGVTDGLNFGNPDDKETYWIMEEVIRGIKDSCKEFGSPVVSGNVSLYNESDKKSIYPSPIIGMLGLISKLKYVVTKDFKDDQDIILLLGEHSEELGGSEYLYQVHKIEGGRLGVTELGKEKLIQESCIGLINQGLVKSAHDISEGGLLVSVSESCIGGDVGAKLNLSYNMDERGILFSEAQSRIIVSVCPSKVKKVVSYLKGHDIPYSEIGVVTKEKELKVDEYIDIKVSKLREYWGKIS